MITDITAEIDIVDPLAGVAKLENLIVEIPEIRMQNIGAHDEQGVVMSELSNIVVKAVLTAVGGVRLGKDVRRHPPTEGVEVDLGQEAAAIGVGLVGNGRVRVVVVLDQPMARGHTGDQVAAGKDVLPEARGINGPGEQGARTDYRDRRSGRCSWLRHTLGIPWC